MHTQGMHTRYVYTCVWAAWSVWISGIHMLKITEVQNIMILKTIAFVILISSACFITICQVLCLRHICELYKEREVTWDLNIAILFAPKLDF